MAAQIFYADGRVETATPKNGKQFELAELQKVVGGYIEILRTTDGRFMVVNEEGKLRNLAINKKATELYGLDLIVGDVLVCTDDMID